MKTIKKPLRRSIRTLWCITLSSLLALSQAPRTAQAASANLKLNYQGYLTDAGGIPVEGPQGFIFRIHDGNNGPTVVWQSLCTTITVSAGVVRATLGDTNEATWNAINWAGIDAHIEMIVGDATTCANPVAMVPQERILSSAYSLTGASSSPSWANAGSNLTFNGGNVGIGTTNPTSKLEIQNDSPDRSLFIGSVGPSLHLANGTSATYTAQGLLAMATVNGHYNLSAGDVLLAAYGPTRGNLYLNSNYQGGGVTNVILQPSSGNVGIGTTNPGAKLDVAGDINFTGQLRQNGTTFGASQWSNSGSNISYSSGNVGIGTTAPGSLLTVQKTIASPDKALTSDSGINIVATNYTNGRMWPALTWSVGDDSPTKARIGIWGQMTNSGDSLFIGTNNNNAVGINNTALTVRHDGNVGIGTTGPGRRLEVNEGGGALIRSVGDFEFNMIGGNGTAYSQLFSIRNNNVNSVHINTQNGARLALGVNTGTAASSVTEQLTINSNGNVGIGTTGPSKLLTVKSLNNVTGPISSLASMGPNILLLDTQNSAVNEKTGIATQFATGGIPSALIFGREGAAWGTSVGLYTHNDDAVTLDQMAERMHIAANGNVGIGTASPQAKLDVQGGAIKASGGFILETRASDPPNPQPGQMWLIQ